MVKFIITEDVIAGMADNYGVRSRAWTPREFYICLLLTSFVL